MAARDIMPFRSAHGGAYAVRWAPMGDGETFEIGEPVGLDNDGTLIEMPIDESPVVPGDADTGLQMGIACFGPGAGNINPQTGVAFAENDMVAYWPVNRGIIFMSNNFMNTGMTAAVVPLHTDVGESYQISYSTAAPIGWGVEQTAGVAGTDLEAHIVDVLDVNLAPLNRSAGTGVWLLFDLIITSS